MEKRDDLDKYFSFLNNTLFKNEGQEFPSYFKNAYLAGDNTLYQKNISETKIFDDEWITTLESYFPSIDNITRNPRSFIKYYSEIVDVERAKKTNAESIRHLASHSQFVREVDKDNNITPSKILNVYSDTEFDVYENRFIATLINRMFLFVRNRLDVIRENVESFQKDHVAIESKFNICEDDVDVKIDVTIKRDIDNKTINEKNYKLLDRVEKLSKLIDGLKGSQFMQMMKNTKVVRPPIMKTNVILKNPDFRNAYTLWLFLDRYTTLGYDVQHGEKDLELDTNYRKYIDELVMINFATILSNQIKREKKYSEVEYKEKLRKRKKVLRGNLEEDLEDPTDLEMEDTVINEYFLNKYKKIFNDTVTEMEKFGEVRHDDAVKRAIRKTTDVVNSIFEGIFKFEEETDIFRKLVEKEDVDKEYETKKNQLKYAKLIREVKQVDLKKAVRQERKLLKELQKLNNKYVKQKMLEKAQSEKPSDIAQIEVETMRLKAESKEFAKRLAILENVDKLNAGESEEIKESRNKVIMEAKAELKAFEVELRRKIAEERALIRKDYKEAQREALQLQKREEKAIIARRENVTRIIEENHKEVMAKLLAEKEALETKYNDVVLAEKEEKEREQILLEERNRRRLEADEQKERERIAILKVKAFEEKVTVEEEIKKLKKAIDG